MYYQIFICFGWILTTMGRPKVGQRKIKTGVTIDPELYEWVQSKIESKEFANLTHAVERGLYLLKDEIEGRK